MVLALNKTKRLLPVNHTTKAIHYHHHQQQQQHQQKFLSQKLGWEYWKPQLKMFMIQRWHLLHNWHPWPPILITFKREERYKGRPERGRTIIHSKENERIWNKMLNMKGFLLDFDGAQIDAKRVWSNDKGCDRTHRNSWEKGSHSESHNILKIAFSIFFDKSKCDRNCQSQPVSIGLKIKIWLRLRLSVSLSHLVLFFILRPSVLRYAFKVKLKQIKMYEVQKF